MTIFEKMIQKEVPVEPVYEDEYVLAIRDIAPQAPQHILILPKRHATCLNDITQWSDAQAGQLIKAAVIVARTLGLADDGYRIVINTKEQAGQTVPYLHLHLLGGAPLD